MHKDSSKIYRLVNDEVLGRCLVATCDIPNNDTVLTETPIVIGPKFANPEPVCVGCLKPVTLGEKYHRCLRCLWPSCSPECSHLDEGFHAIECTILAYGKASMLQNPHYRYEAITPLRCLIFQKSSPRRWKIMTQMEHHLEHRQPGTDIHKEVNKIYEYLKETVLKFLPKNMLRDTSADIIHRICAVLDVNSVDITIGSVDLSALYENFSLVEHSCVPNTKLAFNGHKITVRAASTISKDDHISTMYTNCTWGTRMRQEHLWHTKYFRCKCNRCADPTEFGTNFSTLKCNTCQGYVLPENPLIENSEWKCSKCAVSMTSEEVDSIVCRLGYELDQVIQKTPKVGQLEDLLKKLLTFLHPNHFHCFSVKHSLIQAYGHQQGYLQHQLTEQLLNRKIDLSRELVSIVSKLDNTGSRMPLYICVIYYELSSSISEKVHRELSISKILEDELKEARYLLTQAIYILKDEKHPSRGFKLASCCKKLLDTIGCNLSN